MSRVGKLLIAHPNLPNNTPFGKSVVYLYKDDHEGAQGIILNKPTKIDAHDFCLGNKGWDIGIHKEKLRVGGPISTQVTFMLHTDEWTSSSSIPVGNGYMLSADPFMIEKLAVQKPNLWRMFAGCCAWQPGQLDLEMSGKPPYRPENSWLIAEPTTDLVFFQDTQRQWQKCLDSCAKQTIDNFL